MATLQPLQSSVPPPPDLQLHLVVEREEEFDEYHGAGSRRPSTTSLSRFRSCPQLASLTNASQDSPCSDMAPITDKEGNIIHTTPVLRNSLYVDMPGPECGGIRSAASTPTPPSTPGSRRKDQTASSYNSKSQTYSNGASPSSASKLPSQYRTNQIFESMACSIDSQGRHLDDWGPIRSEHLQRFDEFCVRDNNSLMNVPFDDYHDQILDDDRVSETDDGSSLHVCGRYANQSDRRYRNHFQGGTGDNSVDKCSRWLDSLKLNKSDKIKSRSHIQLPPV